jgi:hypothetical protein
MKSQLIVFAANHDSSSNERKKFNGVNNISTNRY